MANARSAAVDRSVPRPAAPPARRAFRDNPRLILAGIAVLVAALIGILVLADRDWTHPQGGGTGVNLLGHVSRWLAWGHRVSIVACGYPGARAEERLGPLTIRRLGGRSTVFPRAIWSGWRGPDSTRVELRTEETTMSSKIHHSGPGAGAPLAMPDGVHTVKAGAVHTGGGYEVFEVEAPRAPMAVTRMGRS